MTVEIDKAALVAPFVNAAKRERYFTLLRSKKGRAKFLQTLDHWRDFDARSATRVPPNQQTLGETARLLRAAGSRENVHVISTNREIDGAVLPLEEALACAIGMGFGTLLICAPGTFAYFESEEQGERYILHLRHAAA